MGGSLILRLANQPLEAALNLNSPLEIPGADFKHHVYPELPWMYKHHLDVERSIYITVRDVELDYSKKMPLEYEEGVVGDRSFYCLGRRGTWHEYARRKGLTRRDTVKITYQRSSEELHISRV